MKSELESLRENNNLLADKLEEMTELALDFEAAYIDAKALLIEHGITEDMQTACKSEVE